MSESVSRRVGSTVGLTLAASLIYVGVGVFRAIKRAAQS